mmetsp:Transcript_12194/g.18309  ORF Transcript_12194/g.18309 Transcript_12194/m.18309 type:complete len:219 (-) Transcript_12194:174-830(-)
MRIFNLIPLAPCPVRIIRSSFLLEHQRSFNGSSREDIILCIPLPVILLLRRCDFGVFHKAIDGSLSREHVGFLFPVPVRFFLRHGWFLHVRALLAFRHQTCLDRIDGKGLSIDRATSGSQTILTTLGSLPAPIIITRTASSILVIRKLLTRTHQVALNRRGRKQILLSSLLLPLPVFLLLRLTSIGIFGALPGPVIDALLVLLRRLLCLVSSCGVGDK